MIRVGSTSLSLSPILIFITMSVTKFEVRPGAYYDSVILMQLQKSLAGLDQVQDAGVVMATPANKDVLKSTGFDLTGVSAGPDDLLIAVKGEDESIAAGAIAQVDALLKANRKGGGAADFRPKSLKAAVELRPESNLVLVSVPGKYAADVVEEALDLGKHVFLYSDNVSLAEEAKLKQKGADKGLLVMGPDCGTAMLNGIGLGFANRVQRGNIGIVAASGTGAQAVSVGVHARGGGISQIVGTGGRDLKEEIGGKAFLQGIQLLTNDPATEIIILISKPPAPEIAAQVIQTVFRCGKPVIINFIGLPVPVPRIANVQFANSLDGAADLAVTSNQISLSADSQPETHFQVNAKRLSGYVRALFSGGTLAYEMTLALQMIFSPLYSNVPIRPEQRIDDVWQSQGHTVIDMGEDLFTQGRLHPMMDNDLRLRRFQQELDDPETGLILLDMVLGDGAHPDPAGEYVPLIEAAMRQRPDIDILFLLIGTDVDIQETARQIELLEKAGAIVYRRLGEVLADLAGRLTDPVGIKPIVWQENFSAINVGVETFYNALSDQGAEVIQVDWRPPAGGNQKMMDILAKFKQKGGG